jgi:paraquat-inducible protein B
VPVSQVTDFKLTMDTVHATISVYLELGPGRFIISGEISQGERAQQRPLEVAIAHGPRARLATQSPVTGQLNSELDLRPAEPRRLAGAASQRSKSRQAPRA